MSRLNVHLSHKSRRELFSLSTCDDCHVKIPSFINEKNAKKHSIQCCSQFYDYDESEGENLLMLSLG